MILTSGATQKLYDCYLPIRKKQRHMSHEQKFKKFMFNEMEIIYRKRKEVMSENFIKLCLEAKYGKHLTREDYADALNRCAFLGDFDIARYIVEEKKIIPQRQDIQIALIKGHDDIVWFLCCHVSVFELIDIFQIK